MDKKQLLNELELLPLQERLDIAWKVIASAPEDAPPPSLTFEQRQELGDRRRHYHLNPGEPTFTLHEIRRKFIGG